MTNDWRAPSRAPGRGPRFARERFIATVLAFALTTGTIHSRTAAAAPSPTADALFAEGRDLLERGRFAEACERLQQSEQLAPAVGTLLNLGFCREQQGKMRSAMDAYAEAEILAQRGRDEKRAAFARERFAAVEPRVMKLVVRVTKPDVAGLAVTRNGQSLPTTDWGKPIAVDPDDFTVEASAPGHLPWRGVVQGKGDGAVLTIVVPPLEAVGRAPAGPSELDVLGLRRVVALGLGGVAAASIGAGVALGLAAKGRHGDADSHCDASGCDPVGVEIQSNAATEGNVATVLVGLGLACIGVGAYLWIRGGDARVGHAPIGRFAIVPTSSGAAASF